MVCALMMSAMVFAALPAGAAESLVQNGDFSLGLDGWVAGKGATVDMEADNPRLEVGAQTDVTSVPMPIVAGKKYVINYKVDSPLDQLRTYIRWLGEDAQFMGDSLAVSEYVNGITTGSWSEKSMTATAPVGAHYMEFRFNIYKYESNTPTYIDDVTVTVTENLITNGDFETGSGSAATGWKLVNSTSTYAWGKTQSWVAPTETEDGCVSFTGGDEKIGYILQDVALLGGVQYKLQFNYKSTSAQGTRFYFNPSFGAYTSNGFSNLYLASTGGEWKSHVLYFKPTESKTYTLTFCERSKANASVCYVDDISLGAVAPTVAFYGEDGKIAQEMEAGNTYTAKYNGCGKDVTMMVAKYKKHANDVLALETVQIKTGTSTLVKENTAGSGTFPEIAGDLPFELTHSETVPTEGEYIYKAFVWDGTRPLQSLKTAMRATLQ